MKNTMTITKKESRHLQFNEITMSKQQFIYMVKDELLKFYTNKLTDFDSYSNSEKEKLINLLQSLAYGKYNKIISDKIPNDFPFDQAYNAKIVITDDLEGCGNLELKISFSPSMEVLDWIQNLEDDNSWLEELRLKLETI
ncbi:hypothetical protein J7E63_11125 [Bacillus sp. ISL-75]|uniref:hypothetical protein n=1 Tax=Bacillus sp. ISL-75 TaxID=2819137 RepID=UPI001BEC0939|nr:hypothetical protein [Bacillus sp. ISL-75]MBT2727486.1 hypothetical protein [Bacillus sp. ISL-75]